MVCAHFIYIRLQEKTNTKDLQVKAFNIDTTVSYLSINLP